MILHVYIMFMTQLIAFGKCVVGLFFFNKEKCNFISLVMGTVIHAFLWMC